MVGGLGRSRGGEESGCVAEAAGGAQEVIGGEAVALFGVAAADVPVEVAAGVEVYSVAISAGCLRGEVVEAVGTCSQREDVSRDRNVLDLPLELFLQIIEYLPAAVLLFLGGWKHSGHGESIEG